MTLRPLCASLLAPCFVAFALTAAPARAHAVVKPLEVGGFEVTHQLVAAGTPTQVFDMITGDLKPWWDHTFSEHPKALYIEPWPGGGFYEIFDGAGNGVVFVSTYDLSAQGADSTAIHFKASFAGKIEKGWAESVDEVWEHFLFERLKAYAGTPEARRRKPWPHNR